jgi:LysR family transcriptional regulator (chromosome initiation inhibitor)
MYNHQELLTLIAIVDKKGFEAAAQALFITTGAVSQRIKSLENQLGSPILIRSNPPKLTKSGEKVMLFARKISLLQEEMINQLQEEQNNGRTTVSIAVNYDSLISWFLDAAAAIGQETDLLIDLQSTNKNATEQLLRKGSVVAAITPKSEAVPGCKSTSLGVLEYLPVCSANFYRQHFNAGVTRESLSVAPVIYFSNEDYSGDSLLHKYNLSPDNVQRHFVPSSRGILHMVEKSIGWAPLPRFLIEDKLANNEIVILDQHIFKVELFWKTWELSSSTLDEVSRIVIKTAREGLSL